MKQQGIVVALIVSMGVLTGCAIGLAPWSAKENQPDTVKEAGDTFGTSMDKAAENADNPGDAVEATGDGGFIDSNGTRDSGDAGADSSITAKGEGNGVLPPLGDFDRTDPDFDLFDPCTEIPAEKLAEAGLGRRLERGFNFTDSVMCVFSLVEEQENGGVVGLSSSDVSMSDHELKNGSRVLYESRTTGAIAFESPFGGDNNCTLSLDTKRGHVSVGYTYAGNQKTFLEKCLAAEGVLGTLLF
ncbi:DUF3558 family protein [Corynebacterium striatum]